MNIETAVNDFVLGNGTNIPSQEVCEVLINNHPTINKFIKEAIENKIQKFLLCHTVIHFNVGQIQ